MKLYSIFLILAISGCTTISESFSYSKVLKEMKGTDYSFHIKKEFKGYNYYEPENLSSNRVVVFIHGGGWSKGSPEEYEFFPDYINKLGMRCILIGYPLIPDVQIEAINKSIDNTFSTLEYDEIVLGGNSAGAHLAISLYNRLSMESRSRVTGLFSISGVVDFSSSNNMILNGLIRKTFREDSELLEREDPIKNLDKGDIPLFVIHSTKDGVVPFIGSQNLLERARALGYGTESITFRNYTHDESYYYPFVNHDAQLEDFDRWLFRE